MALSGRDPGRPVKASPITLIPDLESQECVGRFLFQLGNTLQQTVARSLAALETGLSEVLVNFTVSIRGLDVGLELRIAIVHVAILEAFHIQQVGGTGEILDEQRVVDDVHDAERGDPFLDRDTIGGVQRLRQQLATGDLIDGLQHYATGEHDLGIATVGEGFAEEGVHVRSSQRTALVLDVRVTSRDELVHTTSGAARMALRTGHIQFLLREPEGAFDIEHVLGALLCTLIR